MNGALLPTLAAAALLLAPPARAQVAPTFPSLPYGDGHPRQTLNLFIPQGSATGPRPVVIWLHGGGWRNGSNASTAERTPRLLERGFIVVGVNYRYSNEGTFPAQIHDVKGAVRWLRANAHVYNIDPTRIGVWGASAGGHLAALMGTSGDVPFLEGTVGGNPGHSSRVQAAVSYYGHTDFFAVHPEQAVCGSSESRLLGQCLFLIQQHRFDPAWADWVALAEYAGAVTHVTPDDPPFRLVHGLQDTVVVPMHSQLLHSALSTTGVTSHLTLLPSAGHGIDFIHDQTTADLLAHWLARPGCRADWNNDGQVNSADIAAFISTWLTSVVVASPGGDYNQDGAVNSADLTAFIAAWLEQINGC